MTSDSPLLPIIVSEIEATGPISFARFMELCLCHPEHGYYCSERTRLGRDGDFHTSMHAGPVFARLLARRLHSLWQALDRPEKFDLMELGPGDGQMISELLPWVAHRFPDFSGHLHYTAIEQSAPFRDRLRENLAAFADRVHILNDVPSLPSEKDQLTGCIFANEFFDALPVHIMVWRGGRWRERRVSMKGDALDWIEQDATDSQMLSEAEKRFDPNTAPEEREDSRVAELRPAAGEWMARAGGWLKRGEMVIVDYGYALGEWRHVRFPRFPHFPQGSALAYWKHQVIEDLLARPGDQDLTAHVDFTGLMAAGEGAGLSVADFSDQEKFLMEIGEQDQFQDVFSDCTTEPERLLRAQLLKMLIVPQGMGSTFRVLRMRKAMGS